MDVGTSQSSIQRPVRCEPGWLLLATNDPHNDESNNDDDDESDAM